MLLPPYRSHFEKSYIPMAIKANEQWLTASLYYSEPWEYFLAKVIKPYVDVVLQTGVADRFFFERSWEGSPHIRLFFKGNADVLHHILRPNLKEHFQQYFDARPSAAFDGGFMGISPSLLINTVQFEDPNPACQRYGGQREMEVLSKQFHASSIMVLGKLKDKINHWNYNELISNAIKLHLSFSYSVGLSIEETSRFFQFLELDWMTNNMAAAAAHEDGILPYFRRIFDAQKGDIISYHAALWELFKNYRKTEDEGFIAWFHANANAGLELSLALESGKLQTKPGIFPEEQFDNPEQAHLWNFFAEFVRSTNNRLGIQGRDEGYLYFAISKSLRAVIATFYAKKKVVTR